MAGGRGRHDALDHSRLVCAACGTPLSGDPDEDPAGDAGMPICGECERNRDFDAMPEGELVDEDDDLR